MTLKTSQLSIQKKNKRDFDNLKEHPTIADLMKEQNVSNKNETTVHRRRDLDSLG